MRRVFPAERAKLAELEPFGVSLLVLIGSVVTPPANRTFKLNKLSHRTLTYSKVKS